MELHGEFLRVLSFGYAQDKSLNLFASCIALCNYLS